MNRDFVTLARLALLAAAFMAISGLTEVPAGAVNGGEAVPAGSHTFTARIQVSPQRSCSGALVAPNWVVTAKSCFPTAPGTSDPVVPESAVAAVGVSDLTRPGGVRGVRVTDLVARPDRDLVLAELDTWVGNVPPIRVAATPPVPGEELRITGYGRSGTRWVPDTARTTTVTAGDSTDTTLAITGQDDKAPVCKGDAGGPAFRQRGDTAELVAIHYLSGQKGCVGAPGEATSSATETRVDGLAGWITSVTDRKSVPASADRWIRPTGYLCTNSDNGGRLRWDGRFLTVVDKANNLRGGVINDSEGEYLHFHKDGNLVIWKDGKQQWSTGTHGHPDARLECGDDYGVTITDGTTVLWQSGTGPTLHASANLEYKAWRTYRAPLCVSPNNQTRMYTWGATLFGPDGWQSIKPPDDSITRFGRDGNLTIRDKTSGTVLWATRTAGHPNARIVCENNNVAIYDGGTKLWDTASHHTLPSTGRSN